MVTRLRVGVVGGLGLMASPMAVHWRGREEVRVTVFGPRADAGADVKFIGHLQ
ncbi:MAG: hypothetical protein ACKVPX_16115 [Myxococcaceae bacterium]